MTGLSDSFQRPINYLRLSITDRCNLRCIYCVPAEGTHVTPRTGLLTFEEITRVALAAVDLGISKIRLTGGEPLLRDSLPDLVRMLAQIRGIEDISLTTNGILLADEARALKEAGLKRVNISLDSLDSQRFQHITRHGHLEAVHRGIRAAAAVGLDPVKINVVVMRGVNEDELAAFARMTIDEGWHVRFIEFMPFGQGGEEEQGWFFPVSEMMASIESLGALEPHPANGYGPAKYYRLPEAKGTIGFISPVSEHFCFQCNRLRLTAEGKLRPCLLSDYEIDLREGLRHGATMDELKRLIVNAVAAKPSGHHLGRAGSPISRSMSQIGG